MSPKADSTFFITTIQFNMQFTKKNTFCEDKTWHMICLSHLRVRSRSWAICLSRSRRRSWLGWETSPELGYPPFRIASGEIPANRDTYKYILRSQQIHFKIPANTFWDPCKYVFEIVFLSQWKYPRNTASDSDCWHSKQRFFGKLSLSHSHQTYIAELFYIQPKLRLESIWDS